MSANSVGSETCIIRRLNQLSRCSRAKVELNTIEFDTTIAQRLNRALLPREIRENAM